MSRIFFWKHQNLQKKLLRGELGLSVMQSCGIEHSVWQHLAVIVFKKFIREDFSVWFSVKSLVGIDCAKLPF